MEVIYIFLIIYIFIFLIDYFILKNLKKIRINEYEYMKKRYKLKKKTNKKIKFISSLINAFIITLVSFFAILVNWSLLFTLPISFILLILLIYSFYGIFGNYLRRKENEEKKSKTKK